MVLVVVRSGVTSVPCWPLNSSQTTRGNAANDGLILSRRSFWRFGGVGSSRAAIMDASAAAAAAAAAAATFTPRGGRGGWGLFGGPPAQFFSSPLQDKGFFHGSAGNIRHERECREIFASFAREANSGTESVSQTPQAPKAGVGTVTLDYLASVESFPSPDAKIRSLDSLAQGGGNVGNALTAAARLGLIPRIFSKLANDASGIGILAELESEGVDVSHIVVTEDGVSPFTYVIVDEKTKTRTCIHTPGYPPLKSTEPQPSAISSFLDEADLLYVDGRLPDAAIRILNEARKRQVPVILDAERKRERLDEMLGFVDYLVTSGNFPQVWTDAPTLVEALINLAVELPHVKFIIVTQGSAGCVMFERSSTETSAVMDPESTLLRLQNEAEQSQNSMPRVFSSEVGLLRASSTENTSDKHVVGRILVGTASVLAAADVLDTTGAGDAFIGGITYGILAGLPAETMLPLGAVVAAANCRALGARTGLPRRGDPSVLELLS